MLRGLGSVISFLTLIPAGNTKLDTVAKYMYAFPIVGIIIGLGVGGLGYGLSETGAAPLLVGLLVAAVLAIVTGLHHTDGLADFADGMMAGGTKEKKLAVMKDVSVGSAGTVAIVLYFAGMIIAVSMSGGMELFKAILFAEIMAKFSMVLMAAMGRSAAAGSNSPFVAIMKDKKRLVAAAVISLVPLVLLGGLEGLVVFAVGITLTMFLVGLASRSFGGITGDVLGAANELLRLGTLLVFVSI